METYVCLLMSNTGQIITVETVTADSDNTAHGRARALIAGHRSAHSYQLWRKGKKLAPEGGR